MMELRDLIILLKRTLPVTFAVAALIALLAFAFATWTAGTPKASTVVSLHFEALAAPQGPAVNYDGYYIVETQRRFGDLLGQILKSDDLREELDEVSKVGLIRVERISPGDYRVVLRGGSGSIAQDTATLRTFVNEELQEAVMRSGEPVAFSVALSEPMRVTTLWSPLRAGVVGALLGALIAVFVVLLRFYLREAATSD